MDLRVTSLIFALLALAQATPDRHYASKVTKVPYPVKSHGESTASAAVFGANAESHKLLPFIFGMLIQLKES